MADALDIAPDAAAKPAPPAPSTPAGPRELIREALAPVLGKQRADAGAILILLVLKAAGWRFIHRDAPHEVVSYRGVEAASEEPQP